MFLLNLMTLLVHFLHFIIRPFLTLTHMRKSPRIPPTKDPLLKISATALARKIRLGELSSQSIVEAYIERIKKVNPILNAVVEDRFEAAIKDAKMCDTKLKIGEVTASSLEKEKPLFGVPVTIKESCSLAGMSLTGGSLARKGMKASEDGSVVNILKNSGAIPLCVTNTSEMCSGIHATNFLFGTTRNPYDTSKSPGGSSGGEGALIGAGASILGIGSDLIGSIRIPAFFNGIFGHKPTPGIIPIEGHFPTSDDPTFQKMLVIGPLTRYADDLHLAVKILSSKCERPLHLDEPVDVKTLRVFYLDNINSLCGTQSTTSDIRRTINEATRYFAESGARVEHLSQEWVRNIYAILMACIGEVDLPEVLLDFKYPEKKKKPVIEFIKAMFGLSNYTVHLTMARALKELHGFVPLSKIQHYKTIREDIRHRFNNLLGNDGVFICPTFSQPAPLPGLVVLQTDCSIYSAFGNIMELPSTQVPMGLNSDGLPIGFQVMAASHHDRLCLAVAKEMEKAFGGWVPPPS